MIQPFLLVFSAVGPMCFFWLLTLQTDRRPRDDISRRFVLVLCHSES